jgi:hypothetical protein
MGTERRNPAPDPSTRAAKTRRRKNPGKIFIENQPIAKVPTKKHPEILGW